MNQTTAQTMTPEQKIEALRTALHIAYDWMGRAPEDKYENAHFKSAAVLVIKALQIQ